MAETIENLGRAWEEHKKLQDELLKAKAEGKTPPRAPTDWLTGNETLLDMVREGLPIYEAYSRTAMGWTGGSLKKENPKLYQQAKVVVLGLGYGAGAVQFKRIAKVMSLFY